LSNAPNIVPLVVNGWSDYALLDSGDGEKLERLGERVLRRTDAAANWPRRLAPNVWDQAAYRFDGHAWYTKGAAMPEDRWPVAWPARNSNVRAWVGPTPFGHVGIFPENAAHWTWLRESIVRMKKVRGDVAPKVLSLFGYTGIASIAAAASGAAVTHVDASFPTIGWAQRNRDLSALDATTIRWIEDDALTFVRREVKRGNKYDIVVMDPPARGAGKKGKATWDIGRNLPELLDALAALMSDGTAAICMTCYRVEWSRDEVIEQLAKPAAALGGEITGGTMGLREGAVDRDARRVLTTGLYARWER